ncbi:MAG: DEAD/DEAH box helicase [Eubacteriales bacterium]|mgnify:CR=1 FL=1|jgi:hypothetical protein|nr:DEAD/DEAH box helicase [Eubacteriales bacterium]
MLEIGDFAFDTLEQANVQVLEKIEVWGYVSYKVFNPATGHVYKATEEQLNSEVGSIRYDENYLRYVVQLSKIKNETAGGFLSSLASGIIPLPHQLHVLNRAMETNNIRYILADEVGLGKTIEAGMIVKELKSRGLVSRVLVVCPTGLVTQPLLETIDAIMSDDKTQKIIIFTEFVATQKYLQELLTNRGFSVTVLNGSMDIEERNEAMQEFKNSTSIFISTDAGGEGLNLQFANIIVNYDLPWNPMKIEQRCGRADRIGQQRDVHIYNFIVSDTVENRVREVLEEKLSVILKEMGVDKYSDVLDSEVAECDFTEVYMRSVGHPGQVEKNTYPVEAEMKQQLANAKKYKDVIREEKDLTRLVGTESDFDVDVALRTMMTYYECWKGNDPRLIDRISIGDEEITKHLRTEILQDRTNPLLSVSIANFPNEAGYFMLWELSISDDESGKRIIPIFVNDDMILRPMAGKRLMDVFLDGTSRLTIGTAPNIKAEKYENLEKLSMEFAYDTFMELKGKQLQLNQESYNKYMYALKLRMEAAEHIGIENIRRGRLAKLEKEKATIESEHKKGTQVYPDFRLMLAVRLEA